MENRYKKREIELQNIAEKWKNALEEEKLKNQRTLEGKNKVIEQFRMELDDLLDAMLELQEQQRKDEAANNGVHKTQIRSADTSSTLNHINQTNEPSKVIREGIQCFFI